MSRFQAAHAAGEDAGSAVSACLAALGPVERDANLGFVYVTDRFASDLEGILGRLRDSTGIADWVGTAGIGVIAAGRDADDAVEYYDRPAIALLVGALPPGSFRLFEPLHGGLGQFRGSHGDWLARATPLFGVVHGDPRNPLTPSIVADLSAATGSYLVGGLTSSRAGHPQVAERVAEGGVSGVLFAADFPVATGLAQGCAPIGPAHTITAADDNIVQTLDGRPAFEVFKADLEALPPEVASAALRALHVALPVAGSDTGDYLVRNLVGIDPERGWIAIGEGVEVGDRLMFARRDRAGAEQDLRRMLGGLARRSAGAARAGLYFSCVARGPNLFGRQSEELRMVRDSLGDFPLVGFFANGEICHNRLYGYTGVLSLFL